MDPLLTYFIKQKFIKEAFAQEIMRICEKQQISPVQILYQHPLPPWQIAQIIAEYLGLPYVDLSSVRKTDLTNHSLDLRFIRDWQVLPIHADSQQITLAISEPAQLSAVNEVKFHTGLQVLPVVVEMPELLRLINEYCSIPHPQTVSTATEDQQISQFVTEILAEAQQKKVSDIHLEPYKPGYRIRFRIDGLLQPVTELSLDVANSSIARIKVMAALDIAERRQPQDGRFTLAINPQEDRDYRVSVCPTLSGEKIVIRLLDSQRAVLDLQQLGLDPQQQQALTTLIQKPQGLILVTGPTGSGKSITLYTLLQKLNHPEKNLATVEDPVEIELAGINQIQINPKIELSFAKALRSLLRQDPDIIMIGEIRDQETADIAIKAAQTGHLVLATLHTNSAAETLARLLNMGMSAFNIVQATQLIIAQRLLRKLCPYCKQMQALDSSLVIPEEFKNSFVKTEIFSAVGCAYCSQGYSGRTGVFEFLHMTPTLQHMILNGALPADIAAENSRNGWQNLQQAAAQKILQGETTWSEYYRVLL